MPFKTRIKLCKPEETCFQSNSRNVNCSRYWDLKHIFTIRLIGIILTFEQTLKSVYCCLKRLWLQNICGVPSKLFCQNFFKPFIKTISTPCCPCTNRTFSDLEGISCNNLVCNEVLNLACFEFIAYHCSASSIAYHKSIAVKEVNFVTSCCAAKCCSLRFSD